MERPFLLHEPQNPFVYPVETDVLCVRLLAESGALRRATVWFKNVYDHPGPYRPIAMTRIAVGLRFDLFEACLQVPERHFRYYFSFETDEGKWDFTAEGRVPSGGVPDAFLVPMISSEEIVTVPDWARGALIYQVLVDRFMDGDPTNNPPVVRPWEALPDRHTYYGGDFAGLIVKLSYLEGLGVKVLYLSPVFRSPSYHKYDVADYETVEAIYGGTEGLKALVTAAHVKGIRVILDGVFNHASSDHPFFQDLLKNQEQSRYRNWFEPHGFPVSMEKANYENFANQVPKMPKWNTSNPEVQGYLCGVAARWTKELGIDGWRLDVADEVAHTFWRRFRREIKRVCPDTLLIGESWSFSGPWLRGDEWDTVTNYRFRKWVLAFFQGEITAETFWKRFADNLMRYPTPTWNLLINLVGSHDTERWLRALSGDRNEHLLSLVLMLFLPGMPLIYYGDEVTMDGGTDPDNRRAMDWAATKDQETQILGQIGLLRRDSPALREGILVSEPSAPDVLVFQRIFGNEAWLIVINRGKEPFSHSGNGWKPRLGSLVTGNEIFVAGGSFALFQKA
ncbi:MAG TPA: alpha amylase N-terminal ig-like domain-containing protein [Candidatus Izemoplasmatales bacterium]|nr:alpha amylase N-terminal ig-like domain-containing protein [Candidatus Izemoplasmatales bacterium]